MTITIVKGNIFNTDKQTLVNAVNCVGVMGAGVALEFKYRYPKMFQKYQAICNAKKLDIGLLWLYRNEQDKILLNFPTKKHWRYPSKESYIRAGLEKFCQTYKEKGITSVAFPVLGAGKGGLAPELSLAIMQEYLGGLDLDIEIYQFDPNAQDKLCTKVCTMLNEYSPRELQSQAGLTQSEIEKISTALAELTITHLSQLQQVKGIGEKTIAKLYQLEVGAMDLPTEAKQQPLL